MGIQRGGRDSRKNPSFPNRITPKKEQVYGSGVRLCILEKLSFLSYLWDTSNQLTATPHTRARACTHTYIYVDGVNQRGQKVALCPCGNLCIRSRNKTWPARVGNWLKAHVARSSNEKNPEPSLWTCRFCEGEKGKRRFPRFYCPLLRSQFLFCFVRFILPCRDRQNFDPSAPFDPSEKS